MPKPQTSSAPTPFPHLARSRDIRILWMLRMLVRLEAFGNVCDSRSTGERDGIFARLRLPDCDPNDQAARMHLRSRLATTLDALEASPRNPAIGRILAANLALLRRHFLLSATEAELFSLVIMLRVDEDLSAVARMSREYVNMPEQYSRILDSKANAIGDAIAPRSHLCRSGLIEVRTGSNVINGVVLRRRSLRKLAIIRIRSVDELFAEFMVPAPLTALAPDDFPHLRPAFGQIKQLLDEALRCARPGVNVLLYGPPGTGKSELSRTLSADLGAPLFEVSSRDLDEMPLDAKTRLSGAATAQFLLDGRRALLCFDEVDAIFNDGSDFFGKPTTAEASKAWVNHLLEHTPVPTIWIANRIRRMDPAFMRRFDLVIQVETPPRSQRLKLLERQCGDALPAARLRRLAHIEDATPAVVSRAASVARRIGSKNPAAHADLLESILDGMLQAQGHPSVQRACAGDSGTGFDVSFCNADTDLAGLAQGLGRNRVGRLCLYGPPGTGKTAFGHWLAEQLDKPLILKRMSDLQSPWLGEMERNLGKAFTQAQHEGAVLQIDEVDAYLRDRRKAERSWEVSQVTEFLTQLESFEGIFVATTNLVEGFDPAALRRFDYKIHMGYLTRDQVRVMLARLLDAFEMGAALDDSALDRVDALDQLTPGDFAVLHRRHRVAPFTSLQDVVSTLGREQQIKTPVTRRIGFV